MAKKPSSKSSATSRKAAPTPQFAADAADAPRARLYSIAGAIAREHGFEPSKAEITALVDEQFMLANDVQIARGRRRADEMLCQKLENDARFREAITLAKSV
jgi:hypothetical protein